MSILSNLKNLFGASAKSLNSDPFDNNIWSQFTLGRTGSSPKSLLNAEQNWVYVCISQIANSLSGIDLKLMQVTAGDKPDQEIYQHKILDILNKPNDFINGRELLYLAHGHAELTGNVYWRKVDNFIVPIPPSNIKPIIRKDFTGIDHYELTTTNGSKIDIGIEEIYHYRYPNLQNPFIGAGVAEKISDWIDIESFALHFNRLFFENGSAVNEVIETKATTQEELDLVYKGWNMRHRGIANAHKTGILPNDATLKTTGQSMRDMEFATLDDKYRDKILAAFGVPKSILGITESGMSRADAEAKNFSFAFFTLDPKQRRFVEWLNNTIVKDLDPTGKLYLDYESIVPEDKQHELETTKSGVANNPYMTINEARERSGLPPIDGGDVLPENSTPTIQLGEPKKQIVKSRVSIVKANSPKPIESAAKSIASAIIKAKAADNSSKPFSDAEERNFEANWTKMINRVEPYEAIITEQTKSYNDSQKRRVLKAMREVLGKKDIDVKGKYDVLNKENEAKLLIEINSPALMELLQKEGEAQMLAISPFGHFDLEDPDTKERFDKYMQSVADTYNNTTAKAIKDQILEGIKEGENVNTIAKRISEVYEFADKNRAELLAKTVTFQVSNEAANSAFKQSGIVKTVKWYTAKDERVCEMCAPMHGKEKRLDSTYYDENDRIDGGSPSQLAFIDIYNPPLHPRCRCSLVAGEIDYKGQKSAEPEPEAEVPDSETKFLELIVDKLNE